MELIHSEENKIPTLVRGDVVESEDFQQRLQQQTCWVLFLHCHLKRVFLAKQICESLSKL